MRFTDRHVVITGASGGLGSAVVEQLVAEGATVHAPIFEPARPAHATWLEHERVVVTPSVDSGDEAAVVAYYAALPALWASIQLVGGFAMGAIADATMADFDKMMAMNARSCFLACREAVRAIRKAGGGGRIVNVAARPAVTPVGGMVGYSASKAAVASITQSLAVELAAERIWVNAVVPSIIDTPANRSSMPKADFASWPKPAELATAIGYLASADNALTSGTLLPLYGTGTAG